MAATGDGISQYIATSATIAAPTTAYSYCFWYNAVAPPVSGGATRIPVSISSVAAAGTYDIGFCWDHSSASFFKGSLHHDSDNIGFTVVQISGTPPSGVWIHIAVTWNGSAMKIYLNGILNNTATGTLSPSGAQGNPKITALGYANGTSSFIDGSIAELAVWNVTLTDADILSLYCGAVASTIGSPLFYDPLNTGVATPVGPVMTNHSTTLNTSYFLNGLTGGPAVGGANFAVAAVYSFSMSGGMAMGGANFPLISTASFADTMTVDDDEREVPTIYDSLIVTPSFPVPVSHAEFSSALRMKAKFTVKGQPLASNRTSAFTTR